MARGGSYTSAGEWGFPKVSPDFFGARGKRGIQVGAVRREPDPGLGGFSHTAGALDASHLQESHWFPKAAPLAWKNGDLRELGTNSGSVGYFKGIPATHTILANPLRAAPAKSRLKKEMQSLVWSTRGGLCHLHCTKSRALVAASGFPPDPLQFLPQTLPAHRFWVRWVTSVTKGRRSADPTKGAGEQHPCGNPPQLRGGESRARGGTTQKSPWW